MWTLTRRDARQPTSRLTLHLVTFARRTRLSALGSLRDLSRLLSFRAEVARRIIFSNCLREIERLEKCEIKTSSTND